MGVRREDFLYIGSKNGPERVLVTAEGVEFHGISCGKLRRYLSFDNFWDFFKIPVGIVQSFFQILSFRPKVIFCKGGYVSFPVAVAGFLARVPVILHESDLVPGLANRLTARFAKYILVSFEESKAYFPHKKVLVTGNPVRGEIMLGNREKALEATGFTQDLPVVLVMGGSLGATKVNEALWRELAQILHHYQVIHICGTGKVGNGAGITSDINLRKRYKSYEYVTHQLKDFYALTDVFVTRAGANSLAEISALGKPSLLIPLSKAASRGDQIDNAKAFKKHHTTIVIEEDKLENGSILKALQELTLGANNSPKGRPNRAAERIAKIIFEL